MYACAAELGYEVFELYPGMGKRSGKELLAAVGDLGRNHMVASGGVGGGAFRKANTSSSSSGGFSNTNNKHPSKALSSSNSTANTNFSNTTPAPTKVRQSLILLEEADLLFEEDKGFWPAIIELVAESKRPVVITCNDLDLIPTHDLPIQEILEFSKTRLGEVVPLLQVVAAGMGRALSAENVREMCLNLPGTDAVLEEDKEEEVGVDLRQALHQLHFGNFSHQHSENGGEDLLERMVVKGVDMRRMARAAEDMSVADVLETGLSGEGEVEMYGEAGVDQVNSRQMAGWTQLVPHPLASHERRRAFEGSAHVEYRSAFAELHTQISGTTSSDEVVEKAFDKRIPSARLAQLQ